MCKDIDKVVNKPLSQREIDIVKKATNIYSAALLRIEQEVENLSFEDALKILKTFNPLIKNVQVDDYQSQKRELEKAVQTKEPIKVKIKFD